MYTLAYTHTCTHRVNHSKNAIVKPQGPTAQEQKKEVEEAMRRVREATMAIAEVIDPGRPRGVLKSGNGSQPHSHGISFASSHPSFFHLQTRKAGYE